LIKAGADVSATYGRAQADFPSLGNFFNQISGGAASVPRSYAIAEPTRIRQRYDSWSDHDAFLPAVDRRFI